MWAAPPPSRRRSLRRTLPRMLTVLALVLSTAAFLIDLHNAITTPTTCEVYCATVPAVEVPALLAWPLLDVLCGVLAAVLFAQRGPRQGLGWVALAALPVQIAVAVQVSVVVRVFG